MDCVAIDLVDAMIKSGNLAGYALEGRDSIKGDGKWLIVEVAENDDNE